MVFAKAAEELGVRKDGAPALADEGGTGKRGWLWREAEEDLMEEILVFQRGHRRRPGISIVIIEDLGY